ncbi:cationic amino acid ABC transporter periplasmic-binding protein [Mycoavidus cysteinexigens]|uniref:Cationic amino acid ABC transporter periplasmic-binding protein n=1 Tax=Mycoavidus cysteinexigens TaxID=1553431 RepID=A0A2Z6ESF3_9BURK|nr:ABC transporter substrate-binding protein [Mycoavidus cysteinexigens]BBE08318.1 cationic amino acid ABC transporter periplasmic-binding protein [Mycoavidus cysteinexigens]GAM52979.1 lysine-arginine-ornithine-binding periplasmic protein precursor [bacterium endosymbiont of Mortierella elongata FMR23-6]GLR00824.1 ABC transporter substrate-binding protein [Mycoavidus cysteinexigens]
MKRLAIYLALALATASVNAKDWKVIRFGVDPSYPPLESKGPDGKVQGLDIELGAALCAQLQAQCIWVEQDFDSMIPALKGRKFDAILSSMTITEPRKKQIDFSNKLFDAPARMVALADAKLTPDAKVLRDKRIGVQQGTTAETYAKRQWAPRGVTIISYANQDQVYADLLSKRLDASLQDEIQAEVGFLKTPRGQGFAFAGPSIKDPETLGQGIAIGLRKGDTDLKEQLNQALAEIRQNGTYQKLTHKYFNRSHYSN